MKIDGITLYNNFQSTEGSFFSFLQKFGVDYVEIGNEWMHSNTKVPMICDLLDVQDLRTNLHVFYHYNNS